MLPRSDVIGLVFRVLIIWLDIISPYGVTVTVKAFSNTPEVLFGLVTRTSQACVPNDLSTAVLTVITIVVGLTTCACVTCGGVP